MLSIREIEINENDVKIKGQAVKECPQGVMLSPLLWNIVLDILSAISVIKAYLL